MRETIVIGSQLTKKDAPAYTLEVIVLFTPNGELPHTRARVSIAGYCPSSG